MRKLVQQLLDDLEAIADKHEELYDTDVREQMSEAVWRGFIDQTDGYTLPGQFGMFSAEGDSAVKATLTKYIDQATEVARRQGLRTPQTRLDAFQDIDATSSGEQQSYDDFFGHRNGP